jgi:VCBS repeat-containing protein
VNTTQRGPGTYHHTFASANDSESGTLTVEDREPATFTVSALSPASRAVTQGTTVEVTATITNVGERDGTQQVRLDVGDSEVDSRSLSLASAESESVTLTVDTSSLAPGAYTHRIATVNDAENGTLTVERAGSPRFTVSALTPATTAVQQGTAVDVTATVTNEGQTTGSQQVRLVLDGTETDSESVSLAPGGNTVVEFDAVDTGSLAVGSHTHTVETANDSRSGTIAVSDDTGGTETTREPGGETTRPPDGTAEPTEVPGNGTQQAPTTAGNDSSGDGGGGSGDDGLVPWGLLQTILLYVGLPLAVVYGVLKALAIYLGY